MSRLAFGLILALLIALVIIGFGAARSRCEASGGHLEYVAWRKTYVCEKS